MDETETVFIKNFFYFMRRHFEKIVLLFAMAFVVIACDKDDNEIVTPGQNTGSGGFEELVPERPNYVNANLVYYGGDQYSESSDYWVLNLYTDMKVEGGYPVGPGQMISLAINSTKNEAQEPSLEYLVANYSVIANSGDFSAGTYIPGEMYTIDLPDGSIEMADGTFFADITAGETDFEPDLLREGNFSISDNDDGTYTVEGVLVGNYYTKRYFSYTGKLEPVDRAGESGEPEIPNTNLTKDVELNGLTKSRLIDKGDYFFLGDESYRLFLLYLAGPTVDLSAEWPSGTGALLRLELFVPWESDAADGIPEGTYTMANRTESGGIPKDAIVPFRIVEGLPDNFEYNMGTWYQELTDGVWTNYGRIADGTVIVEREGDAHIITINLSDCSSPAHSVSGVWKSDSPIGLN